MPKISVIMPAYNAEKYIAEAIESILGQTFGDFEFIIINDCSKDRTEEIILSYGDPRIIYLKNEDNLGVAATLNKGLAVAKGEYIARMDADDISIPNRLERQSKYLDAYPDCGICGSAIQVFGTGISPYIVQYACEHRTIVADQIFNSAFAHPSVMIRRSILQEVGGYDCKFEKAEDYELWHRVLKASKGYNFKEYLLLYRHHGGQVTKQCKPEQTSAVIHLHRKILAEMGANLSEREMEVFLRLCSGERQLIQADYKAFISGANKILDVAGNSRRATRKVYANINIAILCASKIQKCAFFSIKEPLYLIYRLSRRKE